MAVKLAFLYVALVVERVRQSAQCITPQLFVFLCNGRNEVEILRWNDLVCVNVVLHDIHRSLDYLAHNAGKYAHGRVVLATLMELLVGKVGGEGFSGSLLRCHAARIN